MTIHVSPLYDQYKKLEHKLAKQICFPSSTCTTTGLRLNSLLATI